MMSNPLEPTFQDFLSFFPNIELPVTLTEESRFEFSKANKPFPGAVIDTYITPMEEIEADECTEYEPCLRFQVNDEIMAVIYWRGAVYNYEYILVTFNKHANMVSRKVIAGTKFTEQFIQQSVASLMEDFTINVAVGVKKTTDKDYEPQNSQSMSFEILSTGDIIFSLHEELH